MNDHFISGYNFDDIYVQVLRALLKNPQFVSAPRGSKVHENVAVTLAMKNPRARLLHVEKREANYGFAVGEFLWYWNGKSDLETMLYYNKRMRDFSDDGKTLNSAYGWRLRRALPTRGQLIADCATMNQWEVAKVTLLEDADSRRVVLNINDAFDQYEAVTRGSKDVPCTLSLQFFVRDNHLDLHVHMRSNDVIWGLTYDLFSFTLFQEMMYLELKMTEKFKDLELGNYYHTAGSLHLYERHFGLAEKIVDEYETGIKSTRAMESFSDLSELDAVCDAEILIRENKQALVDTSRFEGPSRWMVEQLLAHREKRNSENG